MNGLDWTALFSAAEQVAGWVAGVWQQHTVLIVLAAVFPLVAKVILVVLRLRARRGWRDRARLVEVLPPSDLDLAAALAGGRRLWRDLTGITPPAWRRKVFDHPALALEYRLTAERLTVRIWIPGPIPPGRVEAAVRAAWPGTLLIPATDTPIPTGHTVTGGTVRLERPEYFPLHVTDAREDADPVRALQSLATALQPGECALVQVLLRPGVGGRLRRYRRTVRRLHTNRPTTGSGVSALPAELARELLDLITGSRTPARSTGYSSTRGADPQRAEELREIRGKAVLPQWEVVLRYATATSAAGGVARARVRGLADGVFAMFAVLAGRNALARHHLRHPATALARRRLRRGALLSTTEVAALAHLPVRNPALAGGRARTVPAPPEVFDHPETSN
ncbi:MULTISPECIES: hypothetical protein [unclassified Crossiella]|uniref:hypothetical protein n=1 Tax=unclassified Crossiella TaxID=2620835 RepID=UPI001FFFB4A3|nr:MULTISPECIES: hypothetical protein [unclassified Crossiella]MCK2243677.1 hypothetical protein [Crossiella sp. S99.2]MCK2257536.1 hypothetical protein [Crossiella sp. S99.1]